jgi:hypothetical protein
LIRASRGILALEACRTTAVRLYTENMITLSITHASPMQVVSNPILWVCQIGLHVRGAMLPVPGGRDNTCTTRGPAVVDMRVPPKPLTNQAAHHGRPVIIARKTVSFVLHNGSLSTIHDPPGSSHGAVPCLVLLLWVTWQRC